MRDMTSREKAALDRHITGNYGEDQFTGYAVCPACGQPVDQCQGHEEIGDPTGFLILWQHDEGDHGTCHEEAECRDDSMDEDPMMMPELPPHEEAH